MIFQLVGVRSVAGSVVRLFREGEVVQSGDAAHGVVETVSFEAAVAQDLLRPLPKSARHPESPTPRTEPLDGSRSVVLALVASLIKDLTGAFPGY